MSRADKFEEILKEYEGREYDSQQDDHPWIFGVQLSVRNLFGRLGRLKGPKFRMGFLLGKNYGEEIVVEDAVFSDEYCPGFDIDAFPSRDNLKKEIVGIAAYIGVDDIGIFSLNYDFIVPKLEFDIKPPKLGLMMNQKARYLLKVGDNEKIGDIYEK